MLYREIITVCSEIRAKHVNTLWTERRIMCEDPVHTAQSTHSVSVIKTHKYTVWAERRIIYKDPVCTVQ